MAESMHPAAPHHLPSFITAPGDTDVLMSPDDRDLWFRLEGASTAIERLLNGCPR